MLTKDLIRYRVAGENIVPFWLGRSERNLGVCARLVEAWHKALGRRRAEVADDLALAIGAEIPAPLAKGLVRCMEQSATWSDPESQENFRAQAFDAAAKCLQNPDKNHLVHLETVAKGFSLDGEGLAQRLYCDLPEDQVLASVGIISADVLIDAYNLGLAQGLLLGAFSLTISLPSPGPAERRRILKALRFLRLLAIPKTQGDTFTIEVTGPLSIVEQQSRYGLQFAQLLPHLAANRRWRLTTKIRPPRRECEEATLRLSDQDPLRFHSRYTAFVPPEIASLGEKIAKQQPDWQVDPDPDPILLPGGEIIVPDLKLTIANQSWMVELFHPWHKAALKRRLEQRVGGKLPDFLLGVSNKLATDDATISQNAGVFVFREIPTPKALKQALMSAGHT
jgi:predicted nuclease of restriction endonuclease-like RecB superfamily